MNFSFNSKSYFSGYIDAYPEDVVTECKKRLSTINNMRSDLRRHFVHQYLYEKTKSWRYFWKYLGFKKPTKKMALKVYYKKITKDGVTQFQYVYGIHQRMQEICQSLIKKAKEHEGEKTVSVRVDDLSRACISVQRVDY